MFGARTGLWGGLLALVLGACSGFGASESPQTAGDTPGTNEPGVGSDAGDEGLTGQGLLGFSISVDVSVPTIVQGGQAKLVVSVTRSADAEASGLPITVKIASGPEFAASAVLIPAGTTSGEIELNAAADAPQGERTISLEADISGRGTATTTAKVFVRGKPGSVDTTFGNAGSAIGEFTGTLACHHLLVHDDDRMDAVCTVKYLNSVVMRFMPDGSPDVSFGDKGVVRPDVARDGSGAALQADGKIVLAGRGEDYTSIAVARLLSNGAPDPAFGTNGLVTITVPEGDVFGVDTTVAISPDGSIVVGFTWRRSDGYPRWGVAHLTSSGAFVSATNGFAHGTWDSAAWVFISEVGVRSNGAIFGIGARFDGTLTGIFQITPQHVPDPSFGSPGTPGSATFASDAGDGAMLPRMLALPDGSVVAASYSNAASKWVGSRFRADGNGLEGAKQFIDGDGTFAVLGLDLGGWILAASKRRATGDVELSRFSPTGALDSSFGNGGRATHPTSLGLVTGLGVRSDHRIIMLSQRTVAINVVEAVTTRVWN